MKISVFTISFNSAKTIRDTFESVLNQTYRNIEYIVVDGKSTDGTVDIIKEYEPRFLEAGIDFKYVSEKDNGIYDASNKGIAMCTGDVFGSLNSDDILHEKDAYELIAKKFAEENCDATYSDLYMMDEKMEKPVRIFVAGEGNYKWGWWPPVPTLYIKKDIYEKHWNSERSTQFRIAADYDYILRLMKSGIKLSYIPKPLIYMRAGGESTASLKQYKKSFDESLTVLKANGIRFPLAVNMIRTSRIFKQRLAGALKARKMKGSL